LSPEEAAASAGPLAGCGQAGYKVVVGYASNKAAADSVVGAIEASNGKAIAVKCDVGIEADILNLFKQADAFGKLGALVNNAGVVDATARVDDVG
jgi:NAD(P)-dependent dehydrogenase (short-subunit alcohol dehydrogenase family)